MGDLCDVSLCFVIMAVAVVIAWPIWDIGTSIAVAAGRADRVRIRVRIKSYAIRMDVDQSAVLEAIGTMVRAAEAQGLVIGDLEAYYGVRAAISLSRSGAIPLREAIDMVAVNL